MHPCISFSNALDNGNALKRPKEDKTGEAMKNKENFIRDLEELISHPSVLTEGVEGAPFGQAIQDVLLTALAQADRDGFMTKVDPQGYYGYAQIGEGETHFGVLGHLDVVPVGKKEDWKFDPFTLTQEEGYLYGRGVADDKGPTLLAYHALCELLEEGMELKMPVRFIYGTDEESGWRCMERYVKKETHPVMGFTPDSAFPLVYAEKGVLNLRLRGEGSDLELKAGGALNVVPSEARFPYTPLLEQRLKTLGVESVREEAILVVKGKNAHASKVEEGVNAIVALLSALYDEGARSPGARFVKERLFEAYFAQKLLEIAEDDKSGKASINLGRVDLSGEEEILYLDMRYPVSFLYEELVEELRTVAKAYGFELEITSHLAPIYIDREGELVQSLLGAYRDISGDDTPAQISGGATYARAMENLVAFGPSFPWSESTEHQPNERVKIEELEIAFEIYKEAFRRLVGK